MDPVSKYISVANETIKAHPYLAMIIAFCIGLLF